MFDVNNNFETKETKMKAISLRKIVIAVVIIGIATGYARADKQQLQAKLSRDVKIQLTDVTIAEALEKIGQAAEVKIVLSDEAEWKLPLREATRLSVSLSGPLANSLAEMLNAFFMRYAVGNEEITIYPRAELEHIIGRPNAKKLELLKKIYFVKVSFDGKFSEENVQTLIRQAFGEASFLPYDIPEKIFEIYKTTLTDKGTLPVTFAVLLEQVGDRENAPRWYLSGMDFPDQVPVIRVVSEEDFREAVLDQVVDISFEGKRADVIIQRLAGWAGMELFVVKDDPSWLEEVIVVNMQNIKLSQALRNIVSSVDGEVHIDFGGNYIEIKGPIHPQKPAAPRRTSGGRDAGEGYVGKISIPMDGGKYFIEFMLRQSDLTEELKRLREDKIKEIFRKVGKASDKAPEIAARSQPYSILN